jgi:catechol 2,3-dioxygenase
LHNTILPIKTGISGIKLRVSNLDSSLKFYSGHLGFQVFEKKSNYAMLSASGKPPYQVFLVESHGSDPVSRKTAGLYHAAIKVPNRQELAMILKKLSQKEVRFHGFSDHLVSEALYLADPDGNGIEIYSDRPKEQWKWSNGQVRMDTLPLDAESLLNEVKGMNLHNRLHEDTIIGHIHLRVSDLQKAENFYSKILGFNVTTREYTGALFMSAGGYHHHIGANIWAGENIPPASDKSLGLEHFVIHIPDNNILNKIKANLKENEFGIIDFKNDTNTNGTIIAKDFDRIKVHITSQD